MGESESHPLRRRLPSDQARLRQARIRAAKEKFVEGRTSGFLFYDKDGKEVRVAYKDGKFEDGKIAMFREGEMNPTKLSADELFREPPAPRASRSHTRNVPLSWYGVQV